MAPPTNEPAMMPILAGVDSGKFDDADSELAAIALPLAPMAADELSATDADEGLAVAAAAALAELMDARSMKSGPVCAAPMPAM